MNNFNDALQIVQGADKSVEAFQKLTKLHDSALSEEKVRIKDLIEAFIADGGKTLDINELGANKLN